MMVRLWTDLSISKKLFVAGGFMALLIITEGVFLSFAVNTLSAIGALVDGESTWSKAEKDAVYNLQRYGFTGDQTFYYEFLRQLKVSQDGQDGGEKMLAPAPNLKAVRAELIQGHTHPEDISKVMRFLARFQNTSYLKNAFGTWRKKDHVRADLLRVGYQLHDYMASNPRTDRPVINGFLKSIDAVNDYATQLETGFTNNLIEGRRWLERFFMWSLVFTTFALEVVGLTLVYGLCRYVCSRLRSMNDYASAIGRGEFERKLSVQSRDELGSLAYGLNQIARDLKENIQGRQVVEVELNKTHAELERRIDERTYELQELIQSRDEFFSLASHELNTPLTSLKLQLQLAHEATSESEEKKLIEAAKLNSRLRRVFEVGIRQVNRLALLASDLLDVARLQSGAFRFHFEEVNLSDLVEELADRYYVQFEQLGGSLECHAEESIIARVDRARVEQIVTSLFSSALLYAPAGHTIISLMSDGQRATLTLKNPPFNSSTGTSKARGGLGFGLYMIRQIARIHRGTLRIEDHEDGSALLIVELPLKSLPSWRVVNGSTI